MQHMKHFFSTKKMHFIRVVSKGKEKKKDTKHGRKVQFPYLGLGRIS